MVELFEPLTGFGLVDLLVDSTVDPKVGWMAGVKGTQLARTKVGVTVENWVGLMFDGLVDQMVDHLVAKSAEKLAVLTVEHSVDSKVSMKAA